MNVFLGALIGVWMGYLIIAALDHGEEEVNGSIIPKELCPWCWMDWIVRKVRR